MTNFKQLNRQTTTCLQFHENIATDIGKNPAQPGIVLKWTRDEDKIHQKRTGDKGQERDMWGRGTTEQCPGTKDIERFYTCNATMNSSLTNICLDDI